jgi:Tfp pilus assembly protein PilN
MLRTNLSTQPFYNVRAVQAVIGTLGVMVLLITLFNVAQTIRLTTSQQMLGAHAAEAEAEATRLRQEAIRLRGQIDPKELEVVAGAARAANAVIDQRVFSWTDLLTQLEATLPDDVRATAVQPRTDAGRFIVQIGVEARQEEDLDAFIEALEKTGSFRDVLPATQLEEDGLIQAVVEGVYAAPAREEAATGEGAPAQVGNGAARE